MVGGAGEDSHRLDLRIEHQFLERLVCLVALVDLLQMSTAVRSQVADRMDDAVGIQMPLKRRPETSPDDADADLPIRIQVRPHRTRSSQ